MALSTERVQYEAAMKTLLESLGSGNIGGGTINPTVVNLINYIKAKLDELIPTGEGVVFPISTGANVSDPLSLLIAAHLDEGVKDVCLSAPLTVLFPTALAGEGVHTIGDKTGYIVLPVNFLRLSSFRMAEWERNGILTTPETPLGKRQGNKYLRGGVGKPVAVLDWEMIVVATIPTMSRCLRYYSVETSHTIGKLFYIPEQTASVFIVVNPNLIDSLAWMIVGKIMQITGMVNEAKLAQDRVAQSYLNL